MRGLKESNLEIQAGGKKLVVSQLFCMQQMSDFFFSQLFWRMVGNGIQPCLLFKFSEMLPA